MGHRVLMSLPSKEKIPNKAWSCSNTTSVLGGIIIYVILKDKDPKMEKEAIH